VPQQLLFVDDEPFVLDAFRRTLESFDAPWQMSFTASPHEAWRRIVEQPVDVVISDFNMPGMNGFELLGLMQQRESTRDIPLIIVTGMGERGLRRQALDLGATDLLQKPVDPDDLIARIRNALRLKSFQDDLKLQNEWLEQRVRDRTAELEQSRLDVVRRLAKAAEFRDQETGNHVIRVGLFSRIIAESFGLDRATIDALGVTAPLHDIGKIGIADSILLKPGRLTDDERRTMQGHCVIGARILLEDAASGHVPEADDDWFRAVMQPREAHTLQMAACIALTHHEKWDGSGYPQGLRGETIPIAGRVVALSDVFDALMSRRPYKQGFGEEETTAILAEGSGKHFDPEVHAAFVRAFDEIRAVRADFNDDLPSLLETAVSV
jgi:putative two-component system response regulator